MTELIMMRNKIKELERKLETAINALEFYGIEDNWIGLGLRAKTHDSEPSFRGCPVHGGKRARQALREIKAEQ